MKISRLVRALCVCVFTLGVLPSANALVILDTASLPRGGDYTLGNFSGIPDQDPLGQTFTLDQSIENLMITANINEANAQLSPSLDIIFSVYSGAGMGGALLGSSTVTLPDGFFDFHTEDFSFLGSLSPGIYTAAFSSGGTGRGGIGVTTPSGDPNSDPYNENGIFTIQGDPTMDFMVRVTGDVSLVPVPAAAWLFGTGLMGLFSIARRKKAA